MRDFISFDPENQRMRDRLAISCAGLIQELTRLAHWQFDLEDGRRCLIQTDPNGVEYWVTVTGSEAEPEMRMKFHGIEGLPSVFDSNEGSADVKSIGRIKDILQGALDKRLKDGPPKK